MSSLIYTKEVLQEAANKSFCYSDLIRNVGAARGGNSYTRIKQRIAEYEINISHFHAANQAGYKKSQLEFKKRTPDQIFSKKPARRATGALLTRALIESGVPHICVLCGLGKEWNGRELKLEVDHIDGDWQNNAKDNLRFLCPNCHSQEPTFCNNGKGKRCKNCLKKITSKSTWCRRCSWSFQMKGEKQVTRIRQRKVDHPSQDQLESLVWEMPVTEVAKSYGISDKSVVAWTKKMKIPIPPRGYWQAMRSIQKRIPKISLDNHV